MNTKINFYFWGCQCPYNSYIFNLLNELRQDHNYNINLYDVTEDHKLAEKVNMFSPTLLIFNNSLRWNGPITIDIIKAIAEGNVPDRRPYKIQLGKKIIEGNTEMLTEENVHKVCTCCAPSENKNFCFDKGKWIKNLREEFNLTHLGVLNLSDGKCIGGAEYVPSLAVPYAITKASDIAFLTCSYLSDEVYDYRTYPLIKLEEELRKLNYKWLTAIVSEEVVFPNGTLDWFLQRGFIDMGEIYYEERDFARMHLVKKSLVPHN